MAFLTTDMRCDAGVMISASHNPYHDNGIKFFGRDGFKLPDELEARIEELIGSGELERLRAGPDEIGRARRIDDAAGRYVVFLKKTFPLQLTLDGLRVVLDCANGAAYKVGPTVLAELGAEVFPIGIEPNGRNINTDCGSLHPERLAAKVQELRADVGLAFDGDADRVVVVSERGEVVDGDALLALCARDLHERGLLRGGGVVATVMSNLGLERALAELGLELVRTQVGDRYVLEQMLSRGYNLGGEPSGHIILSDYATTGDGFVAALQVLAVVQKLRRPVSEVCHRFEPLPQILKNVRYRSGKPLDDADVKSAIVDGEKRLNGHGRLLVRSSGTEPVIRVMGEGDDRILVEEVVDHIVNALGHAAAA
jgi:phosphoglucosamine mutase